MRANHDRLVWSGLKGRNGADSPITLDETEAVEVLNMDFAEGALGRKRRGATAEVLTAGPTWQIYGLFRHVPAGTTETGAELWAIGVQLDTTVVAAFRRAPAPSVVWTMPSQVNNTGPTFPTENSAATLNGKLFLAYEGTANRLRVWDGTSIRVVGLIVPGAAPTLANGGTGTYPPVKHYFRVAWAEIGGTPEAPDHIRRSELSPAASFTPSGTGAHIAVTLPTPPGEGETHWLVYVSPDDRYSNYSLAGVKPIADTVFGYASGPQLSSGEEAPPIAGLHIPPPNAKYLITDGNRLLMAGAYMTTSLPGQTVPKNNRVWYTRVLGSSDIGDDESIPNTAASGTVPAQKNWIDIGENDGGAITGLGIVEGVVFVFKRRQTWRLVPTGDDLSPYQAFLVSNEIGAMNHKSIVAGEDAAGAPVLYFYSFRGPYQINLSGLLTYLGRPIEDVWQARPELQPKTFGVYYAERRQVWHHIYGLTPEDHRIAVYDVDRGGWSLFTTAGKVYLCAAMYSETVAMGPTGVMTASVNLKPFFGTAEPAVLWKYDITTAADDVGVPFRALVKSRPFFPAGIGTRVLTQDALLLAEAASGVTLTLTVDRDFGRETRAATVSLTPDGAETRVMRRVEDSGVGMAGVVQLQVGDEAPVSNYWVLEAVSVPVGPQESLT